ncbi:MAG TPA: protease pro-enzyme activation domain-containing protein, partial [Verrucomicrobiae bacterium]|nr:protease pro-enzyme activation domain-containing protein [Verrucomicrobiae bacterium]
MPRVVKRLNLRPIGQLPDTNRLYLAIGLPLRDRGALETFLQQLYDPASPLYHQYLTPEQFAEKFGPTQQDYQAVSDFAKANGLQVAGTHANRLLLDVDGTAADIEKAFQVKILEYQHPTEGRKFYAPDVEPSVPSGIKILDISGLNSYARPRPMSRTVGPPHQ